MQSFVYPSVQVSDPSVGTPGLPAPARAQEVAGVDGSGDLQSISVDTSGNVNTNVLASALPTGAATETTLSSIDTKMDAVATESTLNDVYNELFQKLSGSLVTVPFDEIALTYVTVGNGIGQIETATYKLSSVAVKTLTLSYDSNDRLSGVVAS